MKTQIFLFAAFILFAMSSAAQNRVVYGKITVFNELPISNVEVSSSKTGSTILSDSLGNFALVCADKDLIKVKSKTFKMAKKRLKSGEDSIFINLKFLESRDNIELAIGYGYIEKSRLTTATTMFDETMAPFCSYSDIYELIAGRCPGVMVSKVSNAPGSEQSIFIRGISSINLDNNPLYVVDGVVVTSIIGIAPCDVKSITFLKDSSASIYGSRGANGVIIINTKK